MTQPPTPTTTPMNIAILGSGDVGKSLATGLTKIGHNVTIGTRSPDKLKDWAVKTHDKIKVDSFEAAAKFGQVIFIATLWTGTEAAIKIAGPTNFINKIVVDVTNPLDFTQGMPPKPSLVYPHSAGAYVQSWLPDAKVVKAFNTIGNNIMINAKREAGAPDLFIAGNEEAKQFVTSLAKTWGWNNTIDLGDIQQSYLLENLAMLWITYGFKTNSWTHAIKFLKQ